MILSLNMLNPNMKKLKKHSFKEKPIGKSVFHETNKKWTVYEFNRESLGGKSMVSFYFLALAMRDSKNMICPGFGI